MSVLRRAAKSGLGSAYRAGFREGLARELDVMIEMDSDLSHDPAALPSLLAAIDEGADLVIGSRYVPGGTIPNWGLHRRLLSRWGNRYAGFVLGLPVRDATAGYRAYRATALAEDRPRRDPGRRLRLPDRDGLRRAAQRRPHRRGADLVQRPRARHVEDVEPHRGRGARPRHVVGDPRSRCCVAASRLLALDVGDRALRRGHEGVRLDGEHVVPRARGRPHLVVAEQVAVDEHAERVRVPERRHASDRVPGRRRGPGPRRPACTSLPPASAASFFSSSWFDPLTSASTGSPSIVNTSDFTIWPTSTPIAAAASAAVFVPSGKVWTSTVDAELSARGATTRRRCSGASPHHDRCQTDPVRDWLVGGALIESDDGLLLVRNRRRDGSHDWSTPGGVIEEGEDLLAGLAREVEEETGLVVTEWAGPVYEVRILAPEMGWRLRVEAHRAVAFSGELTLDDPDGIVVDARFVTAAEHEEHLHACSPWVREPLLEWLCRAVGAATRVCVRRRRPRPRLDEGHTTVR